MSTLHIVMPDWAMTRKKYGIKTPYGFWNVADQPMLYHWFDLAQESDYEKTVFHSSDAEFLREHYFDRGNFWPIPCEFTDQPPPEESAGASYSVVTIDSLNGTGASLTDPDIWEMIDHHWRLVTDRLEILWSRYRNLAPGLPVGRRSKVHPTATLKEPYWIGVGCEIGANCTVGPYACIGDHSRLEPGARVTSSHVGAGNVVGVDVELTSHFVGEGMLFNREKNIRHSAIDPLLLSSQGKFSSGSDVKLIG